MRVDVWTTAELWLFQMPALSIFDGRVPENAPGACRSYKHSQ